MIRIFTTFHMFFFLTVLLTTQKCMLGAEGDERIFCVGVIINEKQGMFEA